MSRSNNRIPKQFLLETDACETALKIWQKDISAETIVRRFIADYVQFGTSIAASRAFGIRMLKVWILRRADHNNGEYYRWIRIGKPLYSEPTMDLCTEIERHCVIFVKRLLKEWRNAKLTTA